MTAARLELNAWPNLRIVIQSTARSSLRAPRFRAAAPSMPQVATIGHAAASIATAATE
jgi:hypothetical protein